ncbi:VRR-NUC domain-containing protein [uncultured Brevibacterium sp.]|uniref:VRR-NUC domain-containing protein n=1 Tax=uncultured Brevibacterium sp. TaxID=189678 RepID=UPI0025E2C12B|nr:VRR-NUC domain-containing protein [uncultured Brevibacterium sp.]
MKVSEYRAQIAESMSEKQLQEHVVALARRLGWLVYHTFDSRKSEAGFPDLVLVRDRTVFRELKSSSGSLSPAQQAWVSRLERSGVDVGVWRPVDLLSGAVERELRQ